MTEVKGAFKTSKPRPSAYVDTVGGGLRSKSKCLAKQALFLLEICAARNQDHAITTKTPNR